MRAFVVRHRCYISLVAGVVFNNCCFCTPQGRAADEAGKYVGFGPGTSRCSDIGAALKAGREPIYLAWMSGFITAENYRLAGAKNLLEDQDMFKAWRWVRNFCSDHHDGVTLADVVALLVVNRMEVIAQRYAEESAKIKIRPLESIRTPLH